MSIKYHGYGKEIIGLSGPEEETISGLDENPEMHRAESAHDSPHVDFSSGNTADIENKKRV